MLLLPRHVVNKDGLFNYEGISNQVQMGLDQG